MISIFMFPVDVILGIFGTDPDKPMFFVGLLFILAYIVLVAIAVTALLSLMIVMGFHMLGTIITWF